MRKRKPNERWIFVYGTLMRGLWNHPLMEDGGGTFIGEAETEEGWGLAASGIPYMYQDRLCGRVKGELYLVPNETVIEHLDRLEGHPRHYRRTPLWVRCEGLIYDAEAYVRPMRVVLDCRAVPSGDYRRYLEGQRQAMR